ncbi:MAG TPA: cysteine peptidase family C39 domain-containing protein, partial [Candidatus Caenarcaniphilales bacterium]
MNHHSGTKPQFQNLAASLHVVGLRRLLSQLQIDTALAEAFSQLFEVRQFQLGDEVVSYPLPNTAASENQNLYLVCQGRVRLLCFDQARQREISALALEEDETFGVDWLFCDALPYRVMAASAGQVAWLPLVKLRPWLEELPALRHHLAEQAQQRQCLLFFKSMTDLRSLPSHRLRQFAAYLSEARIAAGTSLTQVAASDAGHFWLRQGQLHSQGNQSRLPGIGESWGYPDPTPPDWSAQTDLLVYRLPVEHWQAAQAILSPLTATSPEQPKPVQAIPRGNGHLGLPTTATLAATQSSSAQQLGNQQVQPRLRNPLLQPEQPLKAPEAEAVAFPKPGGRRRLSRLFRPGYPVIQQQSAADCGAACLAMVGRYWGKRFSLNFLRNLAGVGRAGASLKALAKAGESLGFHARPVRASLSGLQNQTDPWIAHWGGDHYVVVYRVKRDRVLVADPAIGRRSLSVSEFQTGWTGYALLLEPTDQLATVETEKNSLSRFWSVLWPYRSIVLQIIWASLFLQLFGLITPLFTQIILDRVVVQKSMITLHVFALGLILFGVWRVGLTAVRQYLLDYFSNRLDLTLISGFISHTLMLPLQFFESRQVGDILTRVQENQKIQLFLTRQAVAVWLDALMVFVYLGLMVYYNWKLTLLVVAIIPPIVI